MRVRASGLAMAVLAAISTAAILFDAAPAVAADTVGDASATAPAVDAAALWRRMFEQGDAVEVSKSYETLAGLKDDDGVVVAASCKEKQGDLDAAMKANPVGLAIWYGAYECAKALGDDAGAEARLAHFTALVRYAFEGRASDFGSTPIRVMSEADVGAFVRASGGTIAYSYYDVVGGGRYLPLHVGLRDAGDERERLLTFDYLDSRVRLLHKERFAEFPYFRKIVADGFLDMLGANEESAAASALLLRKAIAGDDKATRFAALERLAGSGNDFAATNSFAFLCMAVATDDCATRAVDALLPWAERSNAVALAYLAFAYENGTGVPQDRARARTLLAAADRRAGDAFGSQLFNALWILRTHKTELHPLARPAIEKRAAEGDAFAESLLASMDAGATKGHALRPATLAMLEHAAGAGLAPAQYVLGTYLTDVAKDAPRGMRWIEAAARAEYTVAQRYLASAYEKGGTVTANAESARYWYAEAGRGGDVAAMRWMGRYYRAQPASAETRFRAQGWLVSASIAGDADAALELADLIMEGGEGIEGGAKEAARLYRAVITDNGSADARFRLADLLVDGNGVDQDLAEARALLGKNADAGDVRSRIRLGQLLAGGRYGDAEVEHGVQMLRDVAGTGNASAMIELGIALYYGAKPQRAAAIEWWERASAKDEHLATNDLAWALCTAPEPALRQPARGLELARGITAGDDVSMAFLDTLAACHAAAGDFKAAEAVQQRALERAKAHGSPAPTLDALNQRIALYRARTAYVEHP